MIYNETTTETKGYTNFLWQNMISASNGFLTCGNTYFLFYIT